MTLPTTRPIAVNVSTAAQLLGCSQDVIRAAIRAYRDGDPDGLPAAKLGSRWSIRMEHLERWYSAQTDDD